MRCGLLGRKLGHSYSPQIHRHLGGYSYELFECEPEDLKNFFENQDFQGINVTIPYKKDVIQYCDRLSPIAAQLGAVNTIVRENDGTLTGHNTDYSGFLSMLQHSGLTVKDKKVLVLGSGGASVTVMAVLQELCAEVIQISRSGENNYNNLHRHKDTAVIVNCTPVGMYPQNGISPLDLDLFPALEGVLDLIYNPAKTTLLLNAEAKGLKCENGLWMLVAQAKESAEWFTHQQIPDSMIRQIHRSLSDQMQNIVLIGMPGSGKSTIGRILAQETGKCFIDTDSEIESIAQKSIPDIFSQNGEEFFRKLESDTIEQTGKKSGCVIATGGGCVTRKENYNHLHQNSVIVWIQRDISLLSTDGRPLSQSNSLTSLYEARKALYESFSDYCVTNSETPEKAAKQILALLQEDHV